MENSTEEGTKVPQRKLGILALKLQSPPGLKWEIMTLNHIK